MSTLAKLVVDDQSTTYPGAGTSPIDQWIGSRLRIRRTSRGITQHDLSNLLGIDRSHLADLETGEKRINASLLHRIGKLLEVQPGYFFQGYREEG